MRRSKFSLSHYKLLTADMGKLVPLTWFEALPGDSIQQATSALIRVSPLLSPVMHPVRIRIHHWFVPNRLIWDNFEDFITGGPDGNDASEHPYILVGSASNSQLSDYLGVPAGTHSPGLECNALPYRAYALIYNEHYRDQDLITELPIVKTDGQDTTTNVAIQNVAWEKDYFTTARPWTQKGDDVLIPIGGEAPLRPRTDDTTNLHIQTQDAQNWQRMTSGGSYVTPANETLGSPSNELMADLSQATGITVNELRLALAVQRYQEARARYGSRYVEYLRYLGVRSSDARLQNPEYLGGGRQVIQFSEVLQSSPSTSPAGVVGELKGHGIAAMRTNRYRRFFEEHGIVMSLMSVVPKAIYTQSLTRGWSRKVKEDYFQKELQFIGEQPVLNSEVNVNHSSRDATFGYQGRYDEYRGIDSDVAGEFNDILDYWHYARVFAGDTALNQSFIDCVPTKRVNASSETNVLYCMVNHSVQARRMLAKVARAKTF